MSRFATASGKHGSGRQFTDAAIQFCLTCIFHSNQPLSPAQTRPTISEVNRHLLRQLSIAAVIDLAELTDCIQLWIQLIDATHSSNISAGVRYPRVLRGR